MNQDMDRAEQYQGENPGYSPGEWYSDPSPQGEESPIQEPVAEKTKEDPKPQADIKAKNRYKSPMFMPC
jgi:hypothetical protein